MVQATLTFVSGGARSGKSAYAERLLTSQTASRLVYIASGVAADEEMKHRIQQHKEDRQQANWHTIEQPKNLHEVLPLLKPGDLVLWDCLTTWLANEMYEGYEEGAPCVQRPGCLEQKQEQLLQTLKQMKEIVSHLVIVSNEVLDEWPHYEKETEIYRQTIGMLHQQLVEFADHAVEMDHGMPIVWKRERI
ncbi:hypothetical protein CSV61_08150 [Sporosarcina sp. P3]|uniref:bifunctional adenosylcobinamide kinase/adenosylcobinamide-phosphate guanylyltransferase n=1 Tax=Sporosarcina sp. P3 TaxID=2048245 RepID=UPI000C1676CE|nr:bifunctional adenosylcobinamide kinase/adenosylcobinamide-phosphate guanylyltransferase [Sporosarcina sp. P3]PID21665.1 hypothetical protein CSV61_08150 [Sporosarcina sp. P3]